MFYVSGLDEADMRPADWAKSKNIFGVGGEIDQLYSYLSAEIKKSDAYKGFSFRLVKYARFLCDNLEPEIKAIRKGTASKVAEAIENESAEIMSKIEGVSQEYKNAFLGR